MVEHDDSLFPIVQVRLSGALDVEDADALASHIDAMAARGRETGLRPIPIIDTRGVVGMPSAPGRSRIGTWLRDRPEADTAQDRKKFLVVDSAPVRMAFTAIAWFSSERARKITLVPSLDAALASAREALLDAGEPLPDGLDDALARARAG